MIMLKLIEAKRFEIEIQSISKAVEEFKEEKNGTIMIHSTSIKCGSSKRFESKIAR